MQLEPMALASPISFMVRCIICSGKSRQHLLLMVSDIYVANAAVRFVLNDIFSGLRADDRQKLLHVS